MTTTPWRLPWIRPLSVQGWARCPKCKWPNLQKRQKKFSAQQQKKPSLLQVIDIYPPHCCWESAGEFSIWTGNLCRQRFLKHAFRLHLCLFISSVSKVNSVRTDNVVQGSLKLICVCIHITMLWSFLYFDFDCLKWMHFFPSGFFFLFLGDEFWCILIFHWNNSEDNSSTDQKVKGDSPGTT